jgi:hypothetical protein
MATQRKPKSTKSKPPASTTGASDTPESKTFFPSPNEQPSILSEPLSFPMELSGEAQTGDEWPAGNSNHSAKETVGSFAAGFGEIPGTHLSAPNPNGEVKFSYENEAAATSNPPARRRSSSFDIQFFDIPPDAEGQVKRSYLVDSTIYINVAHPDFQERMSYSRLGQPKVTDRLGAYIAATVSIHYKDQFYAKYGYMPDRRDLLFDEQVDFIFRLEAALREHLPALERELAKQKKHEGVFE